MPSCSRCEVSWYRCSLLNLGTSHHSRCDPKYRKDDAQTDLRKSIDKAHEHRQNLFIMDETFLVHSNWPRSETIAMRRHVIAMCALYTTPTNKRYL